MSKMIALLEDIAYSLSRQNEEKAEYLRRLYASSQSEATEVHGHVCACGSSAKQVSKPASVRGVQSCAGGGLSLQEIKGLVKVEDDHVKRYKGGEDK